jgi:hypothetical protein
VDAKIIKFDPPIKRWFEYHCYEGEDSCDAELWHHTHQRVEVLEVDTGINCDRGETAPILKVRFPDGFEYEVFADELVKSPKQFYRPDYNYSQGSALRV